MKTILFDWSLYVTYKSYMYDVFDTIFISKFYYNVINFYFYMIFNFIYFI